MKALVYESPETLAIRDVPMPIPQDGDALVRVEYVGICGSDMHGFLGHDDRRPAPLILGHEAAGVVEAGTQDGMKNGMKNGSRVTVNPLVVCGTCHYCSSDRQNLCQSRQIISMPPREGGFAEYLAMPASNLTLVPDNIALDKAALCEPLACGWHAVKKGKHALGVPADEANVLVIGGGAIGIAAFLSLQAQGFNTITLVEPNDTRRDFISQNMQINVKTSEALADRPEFDLVIDAVGYQATRALSCQHVCTGGVIVHIGLGGGESGLDTRRMTLQEITFIGTYCYTPEDFRETAEALFSGQLGALDWFEIRSLEQGQQAFIDIRQGAVSAPKIILQP